LAALHYLSQILLDLDIDVAFNHEPYATSNPDIRIKYVNEDNEDIPSHPTIPIERQF
jgi:chromatin remodeling complex protein RSC6